MANNPILSIYAHFLLAVSVVILAIGSYMMLQHLSGRFILSEYPIGYDETRCDYPPYPVMEGTVLSDPVSPRPDSVAPAPEPTPDGDQTGSAPTEAIAIGDNERWRKGCQAETAHLRERKMRTDLSNALSVMVVGALVMFPHAWLVRNINRR